MAAAAAAAIGIIVPWSVPNYTAGRLGIIIIITLLKNTCQTHMLT